MDEALAHVAAVLALTDAGWADFRGSPPTIKRQQAEIKRQQAEIKRQQTEIKRRHCNQAWDAARSRTQPKPIFARSPPTIKRQQG